MLKKKIQNYDKLFVDSNMFQIIRYAENVCHDRKFFTKKRQQEPTYTKWVHLCCGVCDADKKSACAVKRRRRFQDKIFWKKMNKISCSFLETMSNPSVSKLYLSLSKDMSGVNSRK